MEAVDTNVLVRILIEDEQQKEQVKKARRFAKKAANLFIPQIVQVELVWVLDAAYDLEKEAIIEILEHLENNEAFHLQNPRQFELALQLYADYAADFSDCLIMVESQVMKCNVVTFDKKFSRLPQVELLTE